MKRKVLVIVVFLIAEHSTFASQVNDSSFPLMGIGIGPTATPQLLYSRARFPLFDKVGSPATSYYAPRYAISGDYGPGLVPTLGRSKKNVSQFPIPAPGAPAPVPAEYRGSPGK